MQHILPIILLIPSSTPFVIRKHPTRTILKFSTDEGSIIHFAEDDLQSLLDSIPSTRSLQPFRTHGSSTDISQLSSRKIIAEIDGSRGKESTLVRLRDHITRASRSGLQDHVLAAYLGPYLTETNNVRSAHGLKLLGNELEDASMVVLGACAAGELNDVALLREVLNRGSVPSEAARNTLVGALCDGASFLGGAAAFRLVLRLLVEARAADGLDAKSAGKLFACIGGRPLRSAPLAWTTSFAAPTMGMDSELALRGAQALSGAEECLPDPRERLVLLLELVEDCRAWGLVPLPREASAALAATAFRAAMEEEWGDGDSVDIRTPTRETATVSGAVSSAGSGSSASSSNGTIARLIVSARGGRATASRDPARQPFISAYRTVLDAGLKWRFFSAS